MARAVGDEGPGEFEQRFSEWSPSAELMAASFEQLQRIASILIQANAGQPPKIVRWPRPTGAAAAIREERRAESHLSLVRRLLPTDRD